MQKRRTLWSNLRNKTVKPQGTFCRIDWWHQSATSCWWRANYCGMKFYKGSRCTNRYTLLMVFLHASASEIIVVQLRFSGYSIGWRGWGWRMWVGSGRIVFSGFSLRIYYYSRLYLHTSLTLFRESIPAKNKVGQFAFMGFGC